MKHIILSTLVLFSFILSSCSNWVNQIDPSSQVSRLPSSELDSLTYYLSIDKFKYYLSDYVIAMEDKLPPPVIQYIKSITVEDIVKMKIPASSLTEAQGYDNIIWNLLKQKGLHNTVNQTQVAWGYNFFKNKLDEAFKLKESKLDIDLSLEEEMTDPNDRTEVKIKALDEKDMTLDSGHYISNRTTRAIFWEANQSERTVEFFLGDSREFLKELKEDKGEILYEIKPLAKNYNKLFVVKYPSEANYRLAITNIGGQDRLQQLLDQLALSKFPGSDLKSKIFVNGDIKKFHAARTEEHITQLKLLPKADRVIIGQKESIDGKFEIFWKLESLKKLKDHDSAFMAQKLLAMSPKDREKLEKMLAVESDFELIFKEKGIIESLYESIGDIISKNPDLNPIKYKTYNFDNFTIEMCDYLFVNSEGKEIRWRVASNVWGDEIIPLAQALKNTGHTRVTYMGTAGAFAGKGIKVGDLVNPEYIMDEEKKLPLKPASLKIEGAINKGSVEHVGSIFTETVEWLKKVNVRSELVEVETSYLRRIFNGPKDELEIFLLVSDVLGSESETLAHATSSKRKNAQNKLLAGLFKRDSKGLPIPTTQTNLTEFEKLKNLVFKALDKKSHAYKYFAFSHLKGKGQALTLKEIDAFLAAQPSFTDQFLLDRLVRVGEIVQEINEQDKGESQFQIAFSKSIAEGTWHPKKDKLKVTIIAKDAESESKLQTILFKKAAYLKSINNFAELTIARSSQDLSLIWMKTPERIDVDFFVKIYTFSSMKNAGVYKGVTYNGNLTLNLLPTSQSDSPMKSFISNHVAGNFIPANKMMTSSCADAMKAFLQVMY